MNRRLSSAALVAAAALTFSLGSPVAAHAEESATSFAPSAARATAQALTTSGASPSADSANVLTSFSYRGGIIRGRGANGIPGKLAINQDAIPPGTSKITADVVKNGRTVGSALLLDGYTYYPNGFNYTGTWGAGSVRLGPVRLTTNGTVNTVNQYSNTFRVRQGVKWNTSPIAKKGSKITFKLRGFKTFNGSKWVSVKKVKLQVKKGKKWKTLKTVKVNGSGNKKFSIKYKGKRKYRVFIPTTATVQGGATGAHRI